MDLVRYDNDYMQMSVVSLRVYLNLVTVYIMVIRG